MSEQPVTVVYHVAAMGNWREVVRHQLAMLREVGITDVDMTYVGPPQHLDWLRQQAAPLRVNVIRHDSNLMHYETFAMQHIEETAQLHDKPIMYLHTKGVSCPWHLAKVKWRLVMEHFTIRPWRKNLEYLKDYDCVGFNWWDHGECHFSGNFWIANASWIRQLPPYWDYHSYKRHDRWSCEGWIGTKPGCNAKSLGCTRQHTWHDDFDFDQFLNFKVTVEAQ